MLTGYEFIAPQDRRDPWLSAMIYRCTVWFIERWHEKRQRREIAEMAKLGDHLLRDIGLTRGDVHWAASRPLDVNSGQLLQRLTRRDL